MSMKNQKLSMTARLPSVEECEKCAFQNECDGGKYCVPSAKKGQPAIYNTIAGKRSRSKRKAIKS